MFGAEVVRDRLEKLAVPAHEFKLDRARVGALAVLVVADHRVRGPSTDYRRPPARFLPAARLNADERT